MLYYWRTFFLSDWKQEFIERAAAFFNALEQPPAVIENDPFADLEPDIYEEELNQIYTFGLRRLKQTRRTLVALLFINSTLYSYHQFTCPTSFT